MKAFHRTFAACLLAAAALLQTGLASAQQQRPEDLIRSTFEDAKATVKQTQDPKKLRAIAEEKLLPYFDFEHMTRLAVGPGWRQATPEQRSQLTEAFRQLLVNTYNSALNQASSLLDKTLDVKPAQKSAGDEKDVLVRSTLRSGSRPPMAIDYRMQDTGKGWKVYDVVVEGVSLVTTYRTEFSEEVRRSGIAGLIKSLEDKNRVLASRT
jgi:phospholipid transport system substrate-binding protein